MRITYCIVAVLIAGVLGDSPRDLGAEGDLQDRAALTAGVKEIAAPGAPGSLAVYDPTASVIVTGVAEGGSAVAVVACGRLGKGRVAAFAHDGYFSAESLQVADTSRLLINAARWAAGANAKPRVGLINGEPLQPTFEREGVFAGRISLDDSFQGANVLVVTPYQLTTPQGNRLRAFVKAGGGLIAAATGWGWQSGSHKPMTEFAGNRLLAGAGISWTDGFADKTGPKGFLVAPEISPFVNAAAALELVKTEKLGGPKDAATALTNIRLALQSTPASATQYRADIRKLLAGLKQVDRIPSREKPVRADDPMRRFAVGLETVLAQQSPLDELMASPAAATFPGAVPTEAPRVERKVTINTAVPGLQILGLYAAPGEKVTVTVPKTAVPLNLAVQIGCHTDQLWHLDTWERCPQIVRRFPISKTQTAVANAFGGLVFIDVPEEARPGKLSVTIKNAVEAPLFRLGETTVADWQKTQRNRPGPWAEVEGKNVIFTVPSLFVRKLDDPEGLMRLWDEMVAAQDAFAASPPRKRPERIVADAQISAGYMHSGYPIMTFIDDSVSLSLDEKRLRKEGSWGHLHELGHNHQKGEWTFEGTGEVTNNLIVLYVFDNVLGLRFDSGHPAIRDRDQRNKRIRDFQTKGAPFQEWKSDPFLALMMDIQVYEAFGPDPFKAVFAEYARLPDSERPKTDDEKRDQWLVRLSRRTGKNLGPFFRAWGVPTSESARSSIAKLPAWMPEGFTPPK